jgi:hypothetical protein
MIDETSNPTLRLMHALGWQGGTIHQVCTVLNCEIEDILYRGPDRFAALLAQAEEIGLRPKEAAQRK